MEGGRVVKDVKGVTGVMESKIKAHEKREAFLHKRIQQSKDRFQLCRKIIHEMHERRADKEFKIEKVEIKTREVEKRLSSIEQRIEMSRQSMRVELTASEDLVTTQKKLKEAFQKQSELQAKIIRGERRKDALEKHVHAVQDKESRYRERMQLLVDRLKYSINRQDELKKSIKEKVDNLRSMHAQIMDLEPKLRQSHTRMRQIEVVCFEFEEKINRKEDEIRNLHKDIIYKKEEQERSIVEYEVKKERKFKGPQAIINLTKAKK